MNTDQQRRDLERQARELRGKRQRQSAEEQRRLDEVERKREPETVDQLAAEVEAMQAELGAAVVAGPEQTPDEPPALASPLPSSSFVTPGPPVTPSDHPDDLNGDDDGDPDDTGA